MTKEANLGHNVSEETRSKISEAMKGEKNPFFGKSHLKNQNEK